MEPVIRLDKVTKRFGSEIALDGLSLEVPAVRCRFSGFRLRDNRLALVVVIVPTLRCRFSGFRSNP